MQVEPRISVRHAAGRGKFMTIFFRTAGTVLLIVAAVLPARPVWALELQPGLWQDTETGTLNGKPMNPKVSTDCMSPDDAKDPVKAAQAMLKQQRSQCSKANVRQNGSVILFELKCGKPGQMSMDIDMTYTLLSPEHVTAVAKSEMNFGGKVYTSNITTDSRRIGACKGKK